MIEAVNMSVATSSMSKAPAVAQVVSSAPDITAAPAKLNVGVSAPYLSPHVNLVGFRKPIFIIRDSTTGEHVRQFPSEAQIKAYTRSADAQAQAQAQAQSQQYEVQRYEAAVDQRALVESSVQYRQARAEVKQVEVKAEPQPQPLPQPGAGSGSSSTQSTFSTEA